MQRMMIWLAVWLSILALLAGAPQPVCAQNEQQGPLTAADGAGGTPARPGSSKPCGAPALPCAPQQEKAQASAQLPDKGNPLYFYAFLEGKPDFPVGPVEEFLRSQPFAREAIARIRRGEGRFVVAPMLQWYCWANERKPFGHSLLFCLLVTLVTWAALPNRMASAQTACRQFFWKSLLAGVLCAVVAAVFVRAVFLTQIGWPLGVVLMGFIQLVLLCGLGIAASLLGHSVGVYLQLEKWVYLRNHEGWRRFVEFLFGAVICALLVQIPCLGRLPRIGTRLVILLALLGVGGLYLTRTNRSTPANPGMAGSQAQQ
jgi:hypothetical protein